MLLSHFRWMEYFNKHSNMKTPYCTNLFYFIFDFHHEDRQEGKVLSLWEKVCLPTQNGERLWTCYSTCQRKTFHNFVIRLHLIFWEMFPANLHWPKGKKIPFLLFFRMKVRIETNQNLDKYYAIVSFCIITFTKWEKITPNVSKRF